MSVRDQIYAVIDEQLVKHPLLKSQRQKIFLGLWKYYLEHGNVPKFEIEEVNEKKARERRAKMKVLK